MDEAAFPTHAEPLEQRERGLVLLVRDGDDPVQPQNAEGVV
jgi:hypothetical protein